MCTKEDISKNIVVNEYTESTFPGNGSELLCDWLVDEVVMKFATVQRYFCSEKAEEHIDKLKEEGYSCPPMELQ